MWIFPKTKERMCQNKMFFPWSHVLCQDMSTRGLTGKAAEWADKKEQHHSVSNRAFDVFEESRKRAIESSGGK